MKSILIPFLNVVGMYISLHQFHRCDNYDKTVVHVTVTAKKVNMDIIDIP